MGRQIALAKLLEDSRAPLLFALSPHSLSLRVGIEDDCDSAHREADSGETPESDCDSRKAMISNHEPESGQGGSRPHGYPQSQKPTSAHRDRLHESPSLPPRPISTDRLRSLRMNSTLSHFLR